MKGITTEWLNRAARDPKNKRDPDEPIDMWIIGPRRAAKPVYVNTSLVGTLIYLTAIIVLNAGMIFLASFYPVN